MDYLKATFILGDFWKL